MKWVGEHERKEKYNVCNQSKGNSFSNSPWMVIAGK
jgi:hypothetical protein